MEVWGPDRLGDLAQLVAAALPAEGLTADELAACCWDDPGVVLGSSDDGAVAGCLRQEGDRQVGYLKLLVVLPAAQDRGLGWDLLAAAESWAFDQGAGEVRLGGSAPFYLWPGIDLRFTRALCLAEAAGYQMSGAVLNASCPTTFRSAPPPGVQVERVLSEEASAAVLASCRRHWPRWVSEASRGIEHGACAGAFAGDGHADAAGGVVGFACHSVNRTGWVGPMATDPVWRRRGVGAALLGSVCRDLMAAGRADAEIAWLGPLGFYARVAGAAVSRVFRTASISRRAWSPRPAGGRAARGSRST